MRAGERVLDVAAGHGNATLAARTGPAGRAATSFGGRLVSTEAIEAMKR